MPPTFALPTPPEAKLALLGTPLAPPSLSLTAMRWQPRSSPPHVTAIGGGVRVEVPPAARRSLWAALRLPRRRGRGPAAPLPEVRGADAPDYRPPGLAVGPACEDSAWGSAGGGGLGRQSSGRAVPWSPNTPGPPEVASNLRALQLCERINSISRFASLHLGCRSECVVEHPVGLVFASCRDSFSKMCEGRGITPARPPYCIEELMAKPFGEPELQG